MNWNLAARLIHFLICQHRNEKGLLCFCCPKTSFPPRSYWKQGPLFLPQTIVWLQGWTFWHPKWVQPTTTCTQHKQRIPYFCRWFHIYTMVAFSTQMKKKQAGSKAMQPHCVLLMCDRERKGRGFDMDSYITMTVSPADCFKPICLNLDWSSNHNVPQREGSWWQNGWWKAW